MDKKYFFSISATLILLGSVLSASGFQKLVELFGVTMVAVGVYFGFGAADASKNVFSEGKPVLKFSISPRKLALVAALTISGTLLSGFAGVIASAMGGK